MILSALLGSLALLSLAITAWQVFLALRFPLHRQARPTGFCPAVSVLKPLKGCDSETANCLRSWFTQQYDGSFEILFGVAFADDPVCDLVRELIAAHPERAARLIICSECLGANAKVSQLIQLERLAEHKILCVSDADVWVAGDFLTQAVIPLQERKVGLVNCLYRFANAQTLAMRWEAMGVNADFWGQVLQALSLKPMDFALGAAMLTTQEHLAGIGGFSALADHLADDYELGQRLARAGKRVVLSTQVVECRSARLSLGEVWRHQLRWARTVRVCRPVSVFFSILGNASLWPLLWVALTPSPLSALGALICLVSRLTSASLLERRMTGATHASAWGMPVLKDLLQVLIWALGFSGTEVTWRGSNYRLEVCGRARLRRALISSRRPNDHAANAATLRGGRNQ